MNLIHIATGEYPISLEEMRRRHPTAPFPASSAQLRRFGYAQVYETPKPTPGDYQQAVESAPEKLDGGYWRQRWTLVDYFTIEEQAQQVVAEKRKLVEIDYKGMIRRQAKRLESKGKILEALLLLKKIGE